MAVLGRSRAPARQTTPTPSRSGARLAPDIPDEDLRMAPKQTTGGDKDPPKPTKPAAPKPPPLHPRELHGKGGKHSMQQSKGRNFRHQGR